MRLSIEAVAMIAKLLQFALLTGTDINDNLKTLLLEEKDGELVVTEAFKQNFEETIARLEKLAMNMTKDSSKL
jgi:hypothetical protein